MDSSYELVLTKVRQLVARHFGVDAAQVGEATLWEDIDGWDSVSFPGFLLTLEDAYQIRLPPEAAVEVLMIGDLARLVHAIVKSC